MNAYVLEYYLNRWSIDVGGCCVGVVKWWVLVGVVMWVDISGCGYVGGISGRGYVGGFMWVWLGGRMN